MFRRALKTTSIVVLVLGLFAGVLLVQSVVNFKGKASGTPANLVVDLSISFPDAKNTWQYFAQGGEEKGRSLAPVLVPLKELNPRYIRIDHMYDFFSVVSAVNGGNITYNWSGLDAYLSDIVSTGAKPFLSLSYTPKLLGNTDTDMPDLGLWKKLVTATIEHISGKSGLKLSGVYYEVWNEPDLFGQFKVYPPKDYRDLYKVTSDAATSAQNVFPFKLGGPGTTALYKNWFDALVKLKSDKGVKLDFFSWHEYGEDTSILDRDISNVNTWRAQSGNSDLELFVTEQGIDAANNPAYDGTLSAFNTFSAVALSADKLQGLFSFEIKDGPGISQRWGRWGLFTHEKFGPPQPKPRYSAFQFLKGMAPGARINVAGNGTHVVAFGRQDEKSTRLFVVNYDPDNVHVEAVPIRFTGITYSKVLFVRRDYQGNSTKLLVIPTNGEWNTVQYFKPNSAAIFELTPQN